MFNRNQFVVLTLLAVLFAVTACREGDSAGVDDEADAEGVHTVWTTSRVVMPAAEEEGPPQRSSPGLDSLNPPCTAMKAPGNVCVTRDVSAYRLFTRREFVDALKAELPVALAQMQSGNVAPVDLAQAAIGPGMAVFTRYSKVLDSGGEPVPVREALSLINQTLDETLVEQEGDFDADTRWALAWFEQSGFAEGAFGVAETLSKAKNTSVQGMVDAGILVSRAGKVRLLPPDELPEDWDPETERRLTVWESVHHLVRVLNRGEEPASEVVATLGAAAEPARELAYRLYRICDQKKRPQEALAYNALIQSWPELASLARQRPPAQQGTLLSQVEEA